MFRLVGSCSCILILAISNFSFAQESRDLASQGKLGSTWPEQEQAMLREQQNDRSNGISYIVSGSIALVGGIAGSSMTGDPLEKGIYALFETIGVASVGYGAYKWQIGDERRLLMTSLQETQELTQDQKLAILLRYQKDKKILEKKERLLKALTHSLIAALNFYNGSQQTQGGVRNTLYFIGGANVLACLSYTF